MIYLEAPAGVGYSYADDKNYTTDDDQVGKVLSTNRPHGYKTLSCSNQSESSDETLNRGPVSVWP